MSELKTTSLSHKDNATGTPNITMFPDGTTSLSGVSGKVVGYQQGVWIPRLASSDNTSVYTHTAQRGTWFRVGNMVTVCFFVQISDKTVSGVGVQVVADLPYNFIDALGANTIFSGSISRATDFTNGWSPSACSMQVYSGRTVITLRTNNNTGNDSYTSVGPGRSSNNATLGGQISYITEDTAWTPINGATVT